ncbi:GNAT family N-acetyltransferase [Vibrio breoganii]
MEKNSTIELVNHCKKDDFIKLLMDVNDEFTPPLNVKINFDEYFYKIKSAANTSEIYFKDQLIGMIVFYDNFEFANITLVCVSHEFRGQGVARALLEKTVAHIKKPIRIKTWVSNYRATKLYESVGFKIKSTQVNIYDVPEVIMEKE